MDQPSIHSRSEIVNAFSDAIVTALRELVNVEAHVEQRHGSKESELPGPTVSARIRLLRETPGEMNLVLSVDAATRLAMLYLPTGTQLADDLIDDVAGEFANVIAGQAKTILKGTPYHYTISTPVVQREPVDVPKLVDNAHARCEISIRSEVGAAVAIIQL